MDDGTLVLFSGGMDSTVALFDAIEGGGRVHALGFDYGQRHRCELVRASRIAVRASTAFEIMKIPAISGGSIAQAGRDLEFDPDPAAAVVPGRNLIFLSLAAARAKTLGLGSIVIGCCLDDALHFPDCRPEFLEAVQATMRLSLDAPSFRVRAPLIGMTKDEVVTRAVVLGCIDAVRDSWSCYDPQHAGVRALVPCGRCGACVLRDRALR